MSKPDVGSLAAQMIEAVRAFVAKAEDALTARMDALESRLKDIPIASKGDRGEPGKDGKSATVEQVMLAIAEPVAKMIEARVAQIPKPKDGESVHRDTVELMVRDAAERLVNAIPRPKDGKDGFGLEDFDIVLEGRSLTMRFSRGDLKVERVLRVPFFDDKGVYRPETKYEKGDGVTFGGHFWIAKKDDPEFKPGDPADVVDGEPACWRLAVRRGRDGKGAK
jgi:hypothetical protein